MTISQELGDSTENMLFRAMCKSKLPVKGKSFEGDRSESAISVAAKRLSQFLERFSRQFQVLKEEGIYLTIPRRTGHIQVGYYFSCFDRQLRTYLAPQDAEKVLLRAWQQWKQPWGKGDILFSLPELEELMCLRGHRDMIRWLSICPGGDRLASIAYDRTVRIWDIRSMSKTTVLRMKEAPTVLPSVHFISRNRLFFRWKDDICIWDTTVEKEVARLVGNYGEMNVLGVSEDRSLIVAMYEGNHIVAWDAKAFTLVHDFKGFISCAHDIMAMFSQEPRFSLRLVPGPLDSAIVRAADNWTVGWCPQRELSVLPSGRAWMGYSGNSVNFFVLEGFSDDGRHAVEGRGYNGR